MKAGERVQERYELIEPLGRGGMAEVWLARDERLERNVAVKFMAANLCTDPEFLVRFFSEAQAVARISHPNVVSVLDFGDFEDRPYLVMECVGGGALSDLTGEPLPPERAVELVAAAARGAGAAHRAGLVHRDVKPANILLDDSAEPKLADFGIVAAAPSERLTATGTAIGSPHYVSPEQASGRPVTPASDVYSLGAVLYELLTGAPPFDADNVMAIAIAHVEQPPAPPSARVAGLPEHLDALVLSCLAKDPAARPPDGDSLAAALEAAETRSTTWMPAAAPPIVEEVEYGDEYDDEPPVEKRRLVPALLLASLALALAGAMYVSGRPDEVAKAGTGRAPQEELDATERPNETTPSPAPVGASSAPAAVPVTTPSPTPTPEPDREEATPTPEPQEEEDQGPLWTPDPTEEPEPSDEPAPSEEPAPSPAPSEQPA